MKTISRLLASATLVTSLAVPATAQTPDWTTSPPSPDPRIGLRAGWFNAQSAAWNMRLVSSSPPSNPFINRATPGDFNFLNSDISFLGNFAIQGNFSGYQVWDISNPRRPVVRNAFVCPGSQSDVSVWRNLMFVSGEANNGRLDCGTQGIADTVSHERLRGLRIFDITDVARPRYLGNVQTCRGSHTHTVVTDPRDSANIYIYISGSSTVRPSAELAGCTTALPDEDPNSSLFRIEVIKVPLAAPDQSRIVSAPRIFNDLAAPARHGETPGDIAAAARAAADARARGEFTATARGRENILLASYTDPLLDSIVRARRGNGRTAADSAALRTAIQRIVDHDPGINPPVRPGAPQGPTSCHDITVYPDIGLAGGACGGYGLLLDIRDPANPRRIGAVADSNFSYWHSATFNNDGTKLLFSDEWGGGLSPRCRVTDKPEWGADAIFTLADNRMTFRSYYKIPAPQTFAENCVAHNGTLIPVPGRDVMSQGWYQGGVSVFDWTDAAHPKEIAFFDRGPMDSTIMHWAGSWAAYWYNGYIYSSDLARGLDIFELTPSPLLTQNEIDAAKTWRPNFLNAQDQPRFTWPASFVVARAYLDQLERSHGLAAERLTAVRRDLARVERMSGARRSEVLSALAESLHADMRGSSDAAKVHLLANTVGEIAGTR